MTQMQYKKYLYTITALENSYLSTPIMYKWILMKEIAMYQTLNKMKAGETLFQGLFWVPKQRVKNLEQTVNEIRTAD